MSYPKPSRSDQLPKRAPLARVIFEALESRVLLNAELGVPPPPDPQLAPQLEEGLEADLSLFAAIAAPPGGGTVNGTAQDDELESGAGDDTLNGLAGNDRYVFADGWGDDTVNDAGGDGHDTLDFSGVTADLRFEIGVGGAVSVFELDESTPNPNDWLHRVTATGIDHVVGGEGDDTFVLIGDAVLSGSIRGGDGDDTLVYEDRAGGATVDFATGKATGVGDGDTALALGGVERAITDDDTSPTPTPLSVTGTRGDDRLEAVAGSGTLTGGRGDDTYVFSDGWGTAEVRDGEDQGEDTLDFSAIGDDLTFTFETVAGLPGWRVTGGPVGVTASSVETLMGGSGDDEFSGATTDVVYKFSDGFGDDEVTGGSADDTLDFSAVTGNLRFEIGANGAVTVLELNENTADPTDWLNRVTASGIENLIGGSGNNEFVMQLGASLDGKIRGNNTGRNTLDYRAWQTDIVVNLAQHSAQAIGGRVLDIQHVIGGDGADQLTGDDADNELTGGLEAGDGSDILRGGGGNDLLVGGEGEDQYFGDAGNDTVSFAAGEAVDADLVRGNAMLQGLTETLDGIENLTGSIFNDVLTGNAGDNVFVGGGGDDDIFGGGGSDTIDFSDVTAAVDVNLATGVVTGGATQTLDSIENVIGTGYGSGQGRGDTVTLGAASNRVFLAAGSGPATVNLGAAGGSDSLVVDAGGRELVGATGVSIDLAGAEDIDHGGHFASVRIEDAGANLTSHDVDQLSQGLRALADRIAELEAEGAFGLDLPLADAAGTSFGALAGFGRVLGKLADKFDEDFRDADGTYLASTTTALRGFFEDWEIDDLREDGDLDATRAWIARTLEITDSLALDASGAVTEVTFRHRLTNERTTFMDLSESAFLTGAGVFFEAGEGFELTSGFDLDFTFGLDTTTASSSFFIDGDDPNDPGDERFAVRAFASLRDELPVELDEIAARVGFMGGSVADGGVLTSLNASANATFALATPRITLAHLQAAGLFTVADAEGSLDSDLEFETGAGLDGALGDGALGIANTDFFDNALDIVLPAESSRFTLATPAELLRMLGQLGEWLSALSGTNILDLAIPFAGNTTLGDALDFGQAFGEEMLRYLVQHDGLRLGAGMRDEDTGELTGRLTDDAGDDSVIAFTVALVTETGAEEAFTVTLRAGATAFNDSAEDLRAQIEQALLASAGDDEDRRALVENVEVLLAEGRIAFRPLAKQTDVTRVTLPRIGNQTLGYDGQRLVVPRSLLAADAFSPSYVGDLGHDIELTLNVDGRSIKVAVERDASNTSSADLLVDLRTAVASALTADAAEGNLPDNRVVNVALAGDRISFTAGANVQQVLLTAVRDPMVLVPDRLSLGLETATFPTAQQLANQLSRVVNDAIGNPDVTVAFNVATRELTLSVSMDRAFDFVDLPFDLGVDLGGFVSIDSAGALRLTADVDLDFTLGIDLDPQEELVVAPPVFQPDLPANGQLSATAEFGFALTQRNFADDQRLSEGHLGVAAFDLAGPSDTDAVAWTPPTNGRLELQGEVLADQHFFLRVSAGSQPDRFVAGVLLSHDTLDNTSIDELADQLAAAMTVALASNGFAGVQISAGAADGSTLELVLTGAPAGTTVALETRDEFRVATLTGIEVAPDAQNDSVDDLVADVQAAIDAALLTAGFGPVADPLLGLETLSTQLNAGGIPVVGEIDVPLDGVLTRDVRFSVVVNSQTVRGVVSAAATQTNGSASDGGVAALARDVEAAINAALDDAGLGAVRLDVRAYVPVGEQSLTVGAQTVTASAPAATGALGDDLVFSLTVNTQTVESSVRIQATRDNTDVDDLAADVQAAINDALRSAGMAPRVTVGSDADGRLTFVAAGGTVAIDFRETSRRQLQYAAVGANLALSFESPQVIAQHTGGRISLTALPSLEQPDAGSPPQVLDRRVGVTIEDFANPAYEELGLLSSPLPFDGRLASDAEFRIVVDGVETAVTVAADPTNDSIEDLLADLNLALSGALGNSEVQVRRVALTDDAATESNRFEFFTAASSGISRITLLALENDPANSAISQLGFSTTDDSSARVQTAEFFIRDASLTGNVRLSADGVEGDALVGFGGEGGLGVGVHFVAGGAVLGTVELDLVNPAAAPPAGEESRVTLEALWNHLGDPDADLTDLVDATITGVVDIDLAAEPVLLGRTPLEPITVSLDLDIVDWLANAPALDVADDPMSIAVSVDGPDLSVYDALSNLTFSDVVDGLQEVLDFLAELQGGDGVLAAILDRPLPLLNQSPNELLVIADDFATLVDELAASPARSLQLLEDTLENLLGLPEQFVTLSIDTADDDLALRIDLVFETSIDTSFGFDLDLADLVALAGADAQAALEGLTNFVGISSTGDLSVGVGGLVRLSFGVELGDGDGSAEALGFIEPELDDDDPTPRGATGVGTLEATGDAQAAADRLAEQDVVFELDVGSTTVVVRVTASDATREPLVVTAATPLADLDNAPQIAAGAGLTVRLSDGTVRNVALDGLATVGDLVSALDDEPGLDADFDAGTQQIAVRDATTGGSASQSGVYVTLTQIAERQELNFSLQVGLNAPAVSVFVAAAAPGTSRRDWLASIEEAIRQALVDAGRINPVAEATVAVAYNAIASGGQLTFQGTKDAIGERLTIRSGGVFSIEHFGNTDVGTVLGLVKHGSVRTTDTDGDGVIRGRSLRTDAPADKNDFRTDVQNAIDAALQNTGAPAVTVNLLPTGNGVGRLQLQTDPGVTLRVRSIGDGDVVPFLYNGEDGTSIRLDARAAGQNLDFTAQVGPFGFYVVDGSAELSAFFAVILVDNADPDGRTYFGDGFEVETDYGGSATASLPLFFPDESTPVNDVDNVLTIAIPDLLAFMGVATGNGEVVDRKAGSVTISTPDLTAFPTPTLIGMLSNPEFLIDGLDSVLLSVQDALDGEILGMELPLIGDGLAPAGQFIADFRDDVLGYLSLKLRQGGLNPVTLVQETLYNIFASESDGDPAAVEVLGFDAGTDAIGVLQGTVLTSGALTRDAELNITVGRDDPVRVVVRAQDVGGDSAQALVDALSDSLRGRGLDDRVTAGFVAVAGGFRLTLTAALATERIAVDTAGAIPLDLFGLRVGALGFLNDATGDGLVDLNDIVKSGFGLFDEFGQFDFLLGDRYVFNQPLDFDLGLPILEFDLDAGVQLSLGWSFAFGFGVSQEDGFYFVTDSPLADGPEELRVDAEVSLLGGLGYAPGAEGVADAAANRTVLTAVAELPSDGRLSRDLTFTLEVGGVALTGITVTANATSGNTTRADLAADIEAAIDAALVQRGLSANLVTAGLHRDTAGRVTGLLELTAAGAASLSIVDRATARGQLGFLALDALDGGRGAGGDYTSLELHLAIDLRDPSAVSDDRLSFAEISSSSTSLGDILVASAEGGARVNLGLVVSFDGFGLDAAMLPAIGTDLFIDWLLSFSTEDGADIGTPVVEFRDITLDLGTFITDFAGPFLADLADVLGPLDFLLDRNTGLLYQRLPVISDLAGETVTLLRLAEMLDTRNRIVPFIQAVEQVYYLANLVTDAAVEAQTAGGAIVLEFGTIKLTDLGGSGKKLSDSKPDLAGLKKNAADEFARSTSAANPATRNFTRTVTRPAAGGGISFDILDPAAIVDLLLGKPDVRLISYDLPPFGFDFEYLQRFPIFPPLFATLRGAFSATIDLGFGYDTLGLNQFRSSGNPLDLVNGFFVDDLVDGLDIPEVTLRGKIAAGASLDAGVASAGVEGGIDALILFNLNDPNLDGRVRLGEMLGNILINYYNPIAVFDASGRFDAYLRAYIEVLFGLWSAEYELARVTLASFDVPFNRTPLLASELGGGVLELNVGTAAKNRIHGSLLDGDDFIRASYANGSVYVDNGGPQQRFTGVSKIVVNGGAGNDTIDLRGLAGSGIEIEIHGGAGDDWLYGATATKNRIFGDEGADHLFGGGLDDELDGGAGNDELTGGGGDDRLLGGLGNDELDGGAGNDVLDGGAGDDVLDGDDGDDVYVFGANWGGDRVVDATTTDAGGAGRDRWDFGAVSTDITFGLGADLKLASIDGVEVLDGGDLRVTATRHGLRSGDHVELAGIELTTAGGTITLRGAATVTVEDGELDTFIVRVPGVPSDAVPVADTGVLRLARAALTVSTLGSADALDPSAPIQVETAVRHGLTTGDRVRLGGIDPMTGRAVVDPTRTYAVTVVDARRFNLDGTTFATSQLALAGAFVQVEVGGSGLIESIDRAGAVVTVASAGHGLAVGDEIAIFGLTGAGESANGIYVVASVDPDDAWFTLSTVASDGARLLTLPAGGLEVAAGVWQLNRTQAASLGNTVTHNGYGIETIQGGRGGDRFETYQTGAAQLLLDGGAGSDTYVAHTINARIATGATSDVRLLDRGNYWDTDRVLFLGSQGGDALAVDQTTVATLVPGSGIDPSFKYGELDVVLGFASGAAGRGVLAAATPLTTGQLERAARMRVTIDTDEPVLVVVEPDDVGGAGSAADLVAALNTAIGGTSLAGRLVASAVTAGGQFQLVLTATDPNAALVVDNVSEGSGIEAVRIDAGGGNDAIAIANTNARTSVQVAAGLGDDLVTVGGPADVGMTAVTLRGIRGTDLTGPILIDGQGGNDRLLVTDAGNTAATSGTLTERRLAGLGMQVALDYRGVEQFGLQLGQGADTLVVERTIDGVTDVAAGSGADTVVVRNVQGTLRVQGEQGGDELTLEASAAGSLTRFAGGAGDDAVRIRTMAGDVEVSGGSEDDTIDVGAGAGLSTTAGSVSDQAKATPAAEAVPGDVNLIKGALSISGGTGLDTLNVDDSADGGDTLLAAAPLAANVAATGRLRGDAHFALTIDGGAAVDVRVAAEPGTLAAANAVPAAVVANGRLSADADFVLLLGGEELELTVRRDTTNGSIDALLDDLNAALELAGIGASRASAVYDSASGRFSLLSKQGETLEMRVRAASTAATELGFADRTQAAFDNDSAEDLAADVNAALRQAGVGDRVAASIAGGRLALTLRDGTMRVNLAANDPAARDLGLVDGQLLQPHNSGTLTISQATGRAILSGLGMGPTADGFPGITYDTIARINIRLGGGNDLFNVRGTLNDELPTWPSLTTIDTGGGDDTILVSDAAPAREPARNHLDGTLDAIGGELSIFAGLGTNVLAISDRGSTVADTGVTITANRIVGLAPAPINYQTTGRFASIDVWAGSGGDQIRVESVLAAHVTSLFANAGDDAVTVVDADPSADGLLLLYGEQGADRLDASAWNTALIMFGDLGEVGFSGADRLPDGVLFAATLASGAAADDVLFGGMRNDLLFGALGADSLSGGLGDDVLIGDLGRVLFVAGELVQVESTELFSGSGDRLAGGAMTQAARFGGDGNDILIGGAGFEVMFGTLAEDVMIFEYGRVTLENGRVVSIVTLGQQPLDLVASQMFGLYLTPWPGVADYVPGRHTPIELPTPHSAVAVSTGDRTRIASHHQQVAQTIRLPGVEFELGSSVLTGGTQALVAQIGMVLADFPGAVIEVGGHTDATGSTEFNQALSQQRAEAVRDALVEQGVDPARLRAVGYGEGRPVADNDTEEGRAQNRRVELTLSEDPEAEDVTDALDDAVLGVLSVHGWRRTQQLREAARAPRRRIDW